MRCRYCFTNVFTITLCLFQAGFILAQEGHVKGKISDGNEILAGASVTIGNKTILTDSNGDYSISLKAGRYILSITHAGYKIEERKVKIEAGETYTYDFILTPTGLLDEVVVLGSLAYKERSNLNTAVPVDVFSEKKIVQTGQAGLIQSLNYLVPALTAEQDRLNQPVTFKGLDPQHLLILVNGVRYHNTSWLNNGVPKFDLGRGSVANDLNSIPFPAVEKVELLRDGASAQYGSDAIAGILNIRLKESYGETSVSLHTGQTYEGDGSKILLGLNGGIQITKKRLKVNKPGFLDYSAYFRYQEPTTRAGEYQGLVYKTYKQAANSADSARIKAEDDAIIQARGIDKNEFSSHNVVSRHYSSGILINYGFPLGNNISLFGMSSLNYRESLLLAAYRFPKDTNQVNTVLFPDGFRAKVNTHNWDITLTAGLRGDTRHNWHWELINSYGSNSNSRYISNSNNASQYAMGKNAPTSFYLGRSYYLQYISNLNFTKDLAKQSNNLKSFNINFGTEWRLENYRQNPGEEASWKNYNQDTTRKNVQGGSQPSIGSISESNAVNKSRNVLGSYIDFELEPNDRLLIDLAGRFEYYSDFGGNLAGKLAGRYKISKIFSLRGSVSNGFRAPGIQQRFYDGTQSFRGSSQTQGIFSNNHEVTRAFGIPSLEAEKSVSLSIGLTSRLSKNISLTIDAYQIRIKNRIVLSGAFRKEGNPDVKLILANYPNIDVVQFYVNAINTRTYGMDVAINGNWNIDQTHLGLTLVANFNRNSIFGPIKTSGKISDTSLYTKTIFGIEEQTTLEKEKPGEKIILLTTVDKNKFGLVLRNTFFGNTATTTLYTNPTDTIYDYFSSKIITDISISYRLKQWLTITAGANNIFNVFPDRLKYYRGSSEGITLYSNGATPFGSNGGYYYVSMSFKFLAKNKKASQKTERPF